MNFEGFYGNERAKAYLNSAFARKALPHALLITGERGIGKKALADIVARAIVCNDDNAPCGNCDACYKSKNGIHPDIVWLGRGCDESVKVDEIRTLKRDALLRPNDAERKVYIIDHAEAMTHQAQDALLKILEEPPSFTYFIILCYNLSDILPTIVSRAAHISLSPLSDEDMLSVISEKLPDTSDSERRELIKTSGGICSFLVEEKNSELTEIAVSIAKALISRDELDIFRAVSVLEKRDRDSVFKILDELIIILRDCLVISSRAEIPVLSRAEDGLSATLAKTFPPKVCVEIVKLLADSKSACIKNIGVSHIAGSLICKLADIAANAVLKG